MYFIFPFSDGQGEMPGTASATQMQAVPLAPGGGVHSLPAMLLELSHVGSLTGSFLTGLGMEMCSESLSVLIMVCICTCTMVMARS